MSARVYFMKRVKDCKDLSIMSPQYVCSQNINKQNLNIADETLTAYSLLSRYHYTKSKNYLKKTISHSSLNSHVYWDTLYVSKTTVVKLTEHHSLKFYIKLGRGWSYFLPAFIELSLYLYFLNLHFISI